MARTVFADHPVEGAVAAGVAGGASENPLLMGGNDSNGLRRAFLTDASGGLAAGAVNGQVVLAASSTQTTGTNATFTAVTGLGKYRQLQAALVVTAAATAAGDTLDVYIDTSPDGGTTLFNVVHFTQVLGNGGVKKFVATLDPGSPGTAVIAVGADAAAGVVRPSMFCDWMQVRYTIVNGSAPSFTFAVLAFGKG